MTPQGLAELFIFANLKTGSKAPQWVYDLRDESPEQDLTRYDELIKLAEWRIGILESGKSLKRNQKELNRIASMLEQSGYHISLTKRDLEKEVREYFRNM